MNINFYATFRPIVGGKTIFLPIGEGCTVEQMLEVVLERYPALRPMMFDTNGSLYSHVHIFINGRDAPYLPDAMQTVLEPEDKIDIFPPVGGG